VASALRYDIGTLRSPKRLPNGSLSVEAFVTRTGVFEYQQADGTTRRELRPADEVFKADALESIANALVTNDHPPVMVGPSNAKQYGVGVVGDSVRRDGDKVRATLTVYDADAIAALENGKRQVSLGYRVDMDETPGVYEGEKYDAIQRSPIANHVAIVEAGRAGPAVAVRMDAQDTTYPAAFMVEPAWHSVTQRSSLSPSQLVNQLHKTIEQVTRMDAVESEKLRIDALAKIEVLTKERDALQGRVDGLTSQLAKAETAKTELHASIPALVQARVALEVEARKHLGAETKLDASDRAVKVAVIEKLSGDKVEERQTDDYVNGRFDSEIKRAVVGADALSAVREASSPRADAANETPEAAHARMVERNRNAYKGNK
jgi:hypothetical protein